MAPALSLTPPSALDVGVKSGRDEFKARDKRLRVSLSSSSLFNPYSLNSASQRVLGFHVLLCSLPMDNLAETASWRPPSESPRTQSPGCSSLFYLRFLEVA